MNEKMTPQEEYDFYADPKNQELHGEPRRRQSKLTELVPVSFAPETMANIRDVADANSVSVPEWIRLVAERRLAADSGGPS